MKSTCWDARAKDSIIKKGQKDTEASTEHFRGGGGGSVFIKIFRRMKMLAFAMIIVFLTFLGLGVKFFRWGKNPLGGIHQVGKSETVKCVASNF